ncbi:transcriptional regulator [Roseibium sp.]|uniref:transcriptional regulator n=1 Tax=Roseibium sp. TaxID=1936156 RepID=UPI003D0A9065
MNQHVSFAEKTDQAWNGAPPDWVKELALIADSTSLSACAKRLSYSTAVLSQTISNKYPGDLEKIEATVRGALMHETVDCPIVGEIGRDQCLKHQAADRAFTNSVRTRLYNACRGGCPHSRLKGGKDA